MILHGLDQVVLAAAAGLDEGLLLDTLDQVVTGEQRETDVLYETWRVVAAVLGVAVDPTDDCFKYLIYR